jgi:hypothetical protein
MSDRRSFAVLHKVAATCIDRQAASATERINAALAGRSPSGRLVLGEAAAEAGPAPPAGQSREEGTEDAS